VMPTGPNANKEDTLLIWVFSLDLHYSCSKNGDQEAISNGRAMKVFWKCVGGGENPLQVQGGTNPSGVNRMEVPVHMLAVVRHELDISVGILPPSHQRDGDWRVGLLNRFDFKKEDAFRNQRFVLRRP